MKYATVIKPVRLMQFAVRVMDVDLPFEDTETIAAEGISRYEEWLSKLGLRTHLLAAGMGKSRLREIANNAVRGIGAVGHYVELDAEVVYRVLELAAMAISWSTAQRSKKGRSHEYFF